HRPTRCQDVRRGPAPAEWRHDHHDRARTPRGPPPFRPAGRRSARAPLRRPLGQPDRALPRIRIPRHAAGGRRLLARPRAALRGHLRRRRLARAADPGRPCARAARLRARAARSAVCDPRHAPACPGSGPPAAGRVRRLLRPLTDPHDGLDSPWVRVSCRLALTPFPPARAWAVGAFATVGGPVAPLVLARTLPPAQNNGLAELMGVAAQYEL